jgi:hypothetical protein
MRSPSWIVVLLVAASFVVPAALCAQDAAEPPNRGFTTIREILDRSCKP